MEGSARGPHNTLCGVCDGAGLMPISKAPCWQCNTGQLKETHADQETVLSDQEFKALYQEQDETPALKPQNEAGFIKGDAGKPTFSLIDGEFEAGLARVLTTGAAKYGDENWKRCTTPWRTYYSALRRHLAALQRGEAADPETGESHVYHAACCLMFLGWFERNGLLLDRPGVGSSPPDGG